MNATSHDDGLVRLMLVWSHREHGLQQQTVLVLGKVLMVVLTLEAEVDEFAFPPGDRR